MIRLTVKVTKYRRDPAYLNKLYRYAVFRWMTAPVSRKPVYIAAVDRCARFMRLAAV